MLMVTIVRFFTNNLDIAFLRFRLTSFDSIYED